MAMTARRPGAAQQITASAGPIDQQGLTDEEKRRRRQQQQGGGVAPGQQAPWATPGSTASTTSSAGPAKNPFSASVYSRPTQTMQGPTVAQFSARPQQTADQASDNPFLAQLRGIAGSAPNAPGGTGTGGMFMPPGGAAGGGANQQPWQRFMQTIALGGAPPSTPDVAAGGGIPLGAGPAPAAPGLGNIPMAPPSGGQGINLGNILGSILNQPRPPAATQLPIPKPPTPAQIPRPPQQQAPQPPQQQPQQPPGNTGITGGMNPGASPVPPPSVFLPPTPNVVPIGAAGPNGNVYTGPPASGPASGPPAQYGGASQTYQPMPPGMGPGVPGYTWYLANGYR